MVKQLGILVSFLLFNLTASSQPGTIVLDYSTAKEIAIDLVKGDSATAELKATRRMLTIVEAQLAVREREVVTLREKEGNYKQQIGGYKMKEQQYELYNADLKSENHTLKTQVKILGVAVGVTSVVATVALMLR